MTDLFIKRPVATCLVMFGLIFFGINSYFNLPVSEMPNIEFPTIVVNASLPGADPETMASSIATPLERQFSSISGLNSMSSTNSLGSTSITLQFDLDRDVDAAGTDVMTKINAAQGDLPSGMPNPPTYTKVNPADSPVLFLRISSDSLPLFKVTGYAKTYVSQRISMISGVAEVDIYGDQTYSPRIQLSPDQLAARGLGIDTVADAIENETVMLPTGSLYGPNKLYTIKADGQLHDAAAYNKQIVAYREKQPIRIRDIGNTIDSTLNNRITCFYNDKHSIIIAIKRQTGSNTVAVVQSVLDLLPEIKSTLPQSITLDTIYSGSESISESINDVVFTLLLSVGLVVLVVFMFLRNVTATFIAAMALPASIIGTFAAMDVLGFSLDNLSAMALILAVGFVVDDAIVMIENVFRHMEMGKTPMQASLEGARQIGFTILSMTLSLAVVFVPIMFMAGILGRILNEMAVTITSAIFVSGFVTLSFTPMLCSRLLSSKRKIAESDPIFGMLEKGYEKALHFALRWRFITLIFSFVLLGVTLWLFTVVPAGFIPPTDAGFFYGFAQSEQSASYDIMRERMKKIGTIIGQDPNMVCSVGVVGVAGPNSSMNQMAFFPITKPQSKRPQHFTADQIIASLYPKVNSIPGVFVFMYNPPAIQIGGKTTKSQYQFTLQGQDIDELYSMANQFKESMSKMPELADVASDMQGNGLRLKLDINRDRANSLGITADAIETALKTAYSSRQLTNLYGTTDTYKVVIEVAPEFQTDPGLLDKLYVTSSDGVLVPLSNLVKITEALGPLVVNHTGQLTSVTLSFNTAPGYSLSQAMAALKGKAANELPADITYLFEGQATAFSESMNSVPFLLFLAVVVIYIILGMLYESFIHPITILSGLPSAAFGGLVTLLFFGRELDLYGFVGIIMLIGIVKKNAIMVIDFAIETEHQGKTPFEAVFQGCVVRFRPIMMTTVAAIAGIMPIAIGFGAGGTSRQPLGLCVAGGLVISQVVTLFLTPVMYTYLDQLQTKLSPKKAEGKA
ncbi:efflux RND transporter permease subunit [Desulfovibrio inopinatus]|uniref:efflux RND transporter permease subunit n=1 Tax=Desulfovibrio inopinatus TaxID=102109 RepID=UPI00041CB865|nr:efflux RND transporter permease subunit [Desulfovibrio inopinatus]